MAELAAAGIVDSTSLSSLRLGQVQTCGVALIRRPHAHVRTTSSPLHVLLASILLVFHARRRMSVLQSDSVLTSNDLLQDLIAKHRQAELNYQVVAQSAEEVRDIENAPAVSSESYLPKSA